MVRALTCLLMATSFKALTATGNLTDREATNGKMELPTLENSEMV